MVRKIELGDALVHSNVIPLIGSKVLEHFLDCHSNCDWGDVGPEEKIENDKAVENNGRIVSVYRTSDVGIFMVITEGDRRLTLVITLQDYERTYLSFTQLKNSQKQD
jgi:hypothetical protein